jgi:hypothetical protein
MCEGLNVLLLLLLLLFIHTFLMPCRCITIIANMDVNLHEPLQKKKQLYWKM